MSHVTTIDLFITDLDALSKACERLGLELVRGQKTFKWYGHFVGDYRKADGIDIKDYGKCEHAIRVKDNKGAYEIGLIKRIDGKPGFRLAWDFYGGGFGLCNKVAYDKAVQPNADKLKDWYAAEVTRKEMRKKGFMVTATQGKGKVQVLCSK